MICNGCYATMSPRMFTTYFSHPLRWVFFYPSTWHIAKSFILDSLVKTSPHEKLNQQAMVSRLAHPFRDLNGHRAAINRHVFA